MVLHPQAESLSVGLRLAAHEERMDVEYRAHRLELVARHDGIGPLVAQEVEQQRREHRPVHDEARIAFDLGDVAAVVVDAVAVEGQRRVAEEQHVVGDPLRSQARDRRRGGGRRRDVVGLRRFAVHDVVELGERDSASSARRISWRTLTNTSGPVRPLFSVTSWIVEVRVSASPMRSGAWNSNWLPAHMRRGSGTGGRNPPRLAWPSGPISDCRCNGRK